jgi:hypothetical protein
MTAIDGNFVIKVRDCRAIQPEGYTLTLELTRAPSADGIGPQVPSHPQGASRPLREGDDHGS